jgi:hypothetical protein
MATFQASDGCTCLIDLVETAIAHCNLCIDGLHMPDGAAATRKHHQQQSHRCHCPTQTPHVLCCVTTDACCKRRCDLLKHALLL